MRTQTRYQQLSSSLSSPVLLHTMSALVCRTLEQVLPGAERPGLVRHQPYEGGDNSWIRPPTCSVALTASHGAIIVCETIDRSLTTILDLPPAMGVLPPAVGLVVQGIVTEAVTNVVRHAFATECVVRVRPLRGLRLKIIDDGRGLPPLYRARSGFQAIDEQVQQLSGHW